ncbi:ADP-ribosylation factor 6 [Grosmannia clavigera kw1407]|uniref:ADP-ribosylation factor 6 n=1 Tax=Grosmannia clavigera (strain kw1407 / UAMH 11150) TaxID=655863 RepID=F0XSA8_GROCL|nr:ADP-ribosylation factor 6 [Grosmannia clavigera kw1407]EFW99472.1 ADP-ribosylation factor 6 [Grosmannia clavigera kw1407]
MLMGEAGAGKTTLLYSLCGFQDFATIPTIGLNAEDITLRDGSGWKFTLWDLGGGCGKQRPLFKHYLTADRFCVFLHDIGQDNCAEESIAAFQGVLEDCSSGGCRHIWVVFNKQDLIRSEDERLAKLGTMAGKYRDLAAPFADKVQVRILLLPGFDAAKHIRIDDMLSEIRKALQQEAKLGAVGHGKVAREASAEASPSEEDLRIAVEMAVAGQREQPSDAFWENFLGGTLTSWDHASHLRAGLGVILEGYLKPRGLFAWTDDFIGHLDRLREDRPDLFRNTAHRTMTMFWLHRIHGALKGYMASTIAAHSSQKTFHLPQLDEFPPILRADCRLMDKNLWRQFYSQGLMFSPRAKNEWCLPDLAMLPDTITAPSTSVVHTAGSLSGSNTTGLAGADLRLPRFAFTVVKKTLSSGSRRGRIVKRALEVLQKATMRQRAAAATGMSPSPPPPPYSETQAYFWIQYVHACLTVPKRDGLPPLQKELPDYGSLRNLSFSVFQAMFSLRGDEWRKFYTAQLWEGVGSRPQMLLPDRRQLPNVFPVPDSQSLDRAKSMLVQEVYQATGSLEDGVAPTLEKMTEEELAFFADLVVDEAEQLPEDEGAAALTGLNGDDSDKTRTDQIGGQYQTIARAELLLFIFRGLTNADISTHAALSDVSIRITGLLQSGWHRCSGVTQAFFWVRMVLGALLQRREDMARVAFGEFVRQHPELALDGLQWTYYSPEVWESVEAKDTYVMPDRQALASTSI